MKNSQGQKVIPANSKKALRILKMQQAKKEFLKDESVIIPELINPPIEEIIESPEKMETINLKDAVDLEIQKLIDSGKLSKKSAKSANRTYLYIYPEDKVNIPGWRSSKEKGGGQSWRGTKRKQMEAICSIICFAKLEGNMEKLKEGIEKFEKQYKEFYSVNDYSIQSISNVSADIVQKALNVIKIVKAS